MTCIVGLVEKGRVYIGGDSAGVGDYSLTIRADKKVFKINKFVFGFTSSFRMGQLLQYTFNPPKYYTDNDIMKYMVTDFVNGIRKCFKDGGFAKKSNEVESAGTFLVGFNNRLFCIEDNYEVNESVDGYNTCGCGYQIANGSLFTSKNKLPKERIITALKAAENHCSGVRGPFSIVST